MGEQASALLSKAVQVSDTELAFAQMELLVQDSAIGTKPGMHPINFELSDTDERWFFDPHARGRFFQKGSHQNAALSLHLNSALLLRIVTEKDMQIRDTDTISAKGDLTSFVALADALVQPYSPVRIRVGAML